MTPKTLRLTHYMEMFSLVKAGVKANPRKFVRDEVPLSKYDVWVIINLPNCIAKDSMQLTKLPELTQTEDSQSVAEFVTFCENLFIKFNIAGGTFKTYNTKYARSVTATLMNLATYGAFDVVDVFSHLWLMYNNGELIIKTELEENLKDEFYYQAIFDEVKRAVSYHKSKLESFVKEFKNSNDFYSADGNKIYKAPLELVEWAIKPYHNDSVLDYISDYNALSDEDMPKLKKPDDEKGCIFAMDKVRYMLKASL